MPTPSRRRRTASPRSVSRGTGHGWPAMAPAAPTDRKVAARLLSCARELHPADGIRKSIAAAADDARRADPPAPPDEVLSERELEVARLVLQGKTYAEIGEAIFISPRTAEHHIAHIRRRLGATSRSDVIAKLRLLVERAGAPRGARARPVDGSWRMDPRNGP